MAKDKYDMSTGDWVSHVEMIGQEENQTKFFDPKDMHPSGECVKIVEHFEGFRSETYYDSAGHLTLGHGFTHGIRPGDTITYEESKKRLLKELDKNYADAVRLHVKVPVTQEMFDALTCFTFNLGPGSLANSTLLKKLNQKDYEGAAEEFEKWIYAGGKVLAGLVRRRKAERALFEGNDWEEYIV